MYRNITLMTLFENLFGWFIKIHFNVKFHDKKVTPYNLLFIGVLEAYN